MSELNEEWAQSIIKLGLIEEKKRLLPAIGGDAYAFESEPQLFVSRLVEKINYYANIDALLRDDKATAKLASEVVKASRK